MSNNTNIINNGKQYQDVSVIFEDAHPQVIGVIADPNQGKTNTLHAIAKYMKAHYEVNLVTYGLHTPIEGALTISSVPELENVKNSLVFIDEFYSLFQLNTNRRNFELLEKSMRTIYQPTANNIWVLVGLPQNFNKFISGKLSKIVFKRCTLVDFINGSMAKRVAMSYGRGELGASMLLVDKDEALVWSSESGHYTWITVPYVESSDAKRFNPPIFRLKPHENVQKISKK